MYRGSIDDEIMYKTFSRQYDQHVNTYAENPSYYGGPPANKNYPNGQGIPEIIANEDYQLYDQGEYDPVDFNSGLIDGQRAAFFQG